MASYLHRIYDKTNQHGREDVLRDVLRYVPESLARWARRTLSALNTRPSSTG